MSDLLYDPKYDPYRHCIETAREKGKDWETVGTLGWTPEKLDLYFQMQHENADWPSLGNTPLERRRKWLEIVAAKRKADDALIYSSRPLVVVGAEESEADIRVPVSAHTSWRLYASHLAMQGWKKAAVDSIETSALRILRHLRKTTRNQPPVRGLVVGYVQSGKTASMAGLMAMSADHGWNLFIVLSGTLENLRIQTRDRLFKDLNHTGNVHWRLINHPSLNSLTGERAQDMQFQPISKSRHIVVSLKNSTRLSDLKKWLTADPTHLSQMRIVIIDDEADQGGINTANISKVERSAINKQIVELTQVKALSVNYVAYTATPAANFLNESPGDSLYPQNFIVALPQSDEHFGPRQIFGAPEMGHEPLGIINTIVKDDVISMAALHAEAESALPDSLEESLLWFLCCVAAMRIYGIRKPVSMLIHTSQRQLHHDNVRVGVCAFLATAQAESEIFFARCAMVWSDVGSHLGTATFADRYPGYGRLTEIPDYPDFDEIRKELPQLLSLVSAIQLDDQRECSYHRGIHLCIDNCANNGINDEGEMSRLFYPSSEKENAPDFATAFIVIGGSTLARGLTLENLVSTYFFRASAQADSLMQMGRWFGYRKGYELLPRIWMPEATREKFEFMTLAEEDLRDDLEQYMYLGADPSEYGPRVRVHPRASWLRPTAKNKMQESKPKEYDFSGVNRQTTLFYDGSEAHEFHTHNLNHTVRFLTAFGKDGETLLGRSKALAWSGIDFPKIGDFLTGFKFHPDAQFFADIAPFVQWYDENAGKAGYGAWNVVVAGIDASGGPGWDLPGGRVGRVRRSRMVSNRHDGAVSIGVLRDPRDLLADAHISAKLPASLTNAAIVKLRNEGGVGDIPQLLLYLVDKDSTPKEQQEESGKLTTDPTREPLAASEHIVGVSIWLPSTGAAKQSYVSHLTVRIPKSMANEDDDLKETGAQGDTS